MKAVQLEAAVLPSVQHVLVSKSLAPHAAAAPSCCMLRAAAVQCITAQLAAATLRAGAHLGRVLTVHCLFHLDARTFSTLSRCSAQLTADRQL